MKKWVFFALKIKESGLNISFGDHMNLNNKNNGIKLIFNANV